MGKTKHNRRKHKANAPTGLPSVKEIEQEVSELGSGDTSTSKRESAILTVIEHLQGSVEDKIVGLHSLATVFDDPESVQDVVKHKIVRIAGPLLLDPSSPVRNSAAGALRNLTVNCDAAVCDLLVEQDVMTPLSALIQKYGGELQPLKKGADTEHQDTFIQAVHLLWNLCESNSTALKHFNDGQLLPILVRYLEGSVFGFETTLAVAQCLHTVTEDNPYAIKVLQKHEALILKLIALEGNDPTVTLLKVLASGLLLNMLYWKVSSIPPPMLTQVLCNLTAALDQDQRKALNSLTSSLPLDAVTSRKKGDGSEDKSVLEVEHLLEAQQTAIEILANLSSSDDADEEAMEQDSSDCSDEVLSDSSLPENEPAGTETWPLTMPPEVHEAIIAQQLVQKIWDKTILPAENVCDILKDHPEGKHIYKRVITVRCRAFLCLNNILSALDVDDLGGPSNLYKMWVSIGNLVFKQANPSDTELLEAATAAMRAALEKLAKVKSDLFGQLQESDIQLLFNGEQQCSDANVRANLIRIVGTLGMIMATSLEERSQAILQNIGKFLLDACSKETELWIIAEALDTIMDVFAEDETDRAAALINLVLKLEALLPTLKHKLRLQRKSLGEHYLIVTTVNANIGRFIKYKTRRMALLQQPT
ncbi:HEAT repeat-containing protein 3 [Anabrus simplex]|uniref:HEAT repeat-containing protein 3 n=1 Tax=Anabrus simplex TaxID=316456 RepID=UPI0035A28BEC